MFNPGQIGINAPPSSLATDTGASPALQILQYRSQLSSSSYALMGSIAQYITGISTSLDEVILPSPEGAENSASGDLYSLGSQIAQQVDPVIQTMIALVNDKITTEEPTFEIQQLIDKATTQIFAELDSVDASVVGARELIMAIVETAQLNSTYTILAADITDVDTYVNAYKANAKSKLDEQIISLDRRDFNQHIVDGTLDSDIGSGILTRAQARKARQYTEIDNEAERIRIEMLQERWQRVIDRERTKIQAGNLLTNDMIRLPDALYNLLAELARRRFIDIDSFARSLPNVLATSAQALSDVKRALQTDRVRATEINIETAREIINLWNVITTNLRGVASSLGAMGTFEAS